MRIILDCEFDDAALGVEVIKQWSEKYPDSPDCVTRTYRPVEIVWYSKRTKTGFSAKGTRQAR